MEICTDMPPDMVKKLIGDSQRFASPFSEPCGYSIWADEESAVNESDIQRYCEKLKYLTEHIDRLLKDAFRPEFCQFYGVDRERIASPDEMRRQLMVDSFVLYKKDGSVGCCLSNVRFMPGHFIECGWNDRWEFTGSYIC